jgi:hypothetical protein
VTTPGQPVSPEPTPPDPTVPPPAAAAAAAMQAPAPNLTPLVVLLLLLVIAAGAAVFLLVKPRLAFTNGLAAPVRVAVGGGAPIVIPAGETAQLSPSFGRTLVAEWELVRPLSADSAPMGETVHGSTVVKSPRGTVRAQATTRPAEADYFAPLITNATSQPLRVLVNAGLQGAMDCGCAVRPGGQRVFIGYYRLFQNSTVQVRGSSGATAVFMDLGPRVTALDGTVGLRFEDSDLRGGKPAPRR